jgi:hypothetical protein
MTVGKLANIQGFSKRKTDSVIVKLTHSITQLGRTFIIIIIIIITIIITNTITIVTITTITRSKEWVRYENKEHDIF